MTNNNIIDNCYFAFHGLLQILLINTICQTNE